MKQSITKIGGWAYVQLGLGHDFPLLKTDKELMKHCQQCWHLVFTMVMGISANMIPGDTNSSTLSNLPRLSRCTLRWSSSATKHRWKIHETGFDRNFHCKYAGDINAVDGATIKLASPCCLLHAIRNCCIKPCQGPKVAVPPCSCGSDGVMFDFCACPNLLGEESQCDLHLRIQFCV